MPLSFTCLLRSAGYVNLWDDIQQRFPATAPRSFCFFSLAARDFRKIFIISLFRLCFFYLWITKNRFEMFGVSCEKVRRSPSFPFSLRPQPLIFHASDSMQVTRSCEVSGLERLGGARSFLRKERIPRN